MNRVLKSTNGGLFRRKTPATPTGNRELCQSRTADTSSQSWISSNAASGPCTITPGVFITFAKTQTNALNIA